MATTIMASAGVAWASDGATNWKQNCAQCHGIDGSGNTKIGRRLNVKDYRDANVQAFFSDGEAERAIKEGVKTNDKQTMQSFASKFSEAEIKALVAYIRSFKK